MVRYQNIAIRPTFYDFISVQGDINCDFSKITGHTNAVHNFIINEKLKILWDSFPVQFTFFAQNKFSTIDHFYVCQNMLNNIIEAGTIDDNENMSDHTPIYLKVRFKKCNVKHETCDKEPRISWSYSTDQQRNAYRSDLKENLSKVNIPENIKNCENVNCTDKDHQNILDSLMENVLNCVTESAWSKLA